MKVIRTMGNFFKSLFVGAYMWRTVYFAFIAIILGIGVFFLIAKFGNRWHLFGLIFALSIYGFYWIYRRR